MTATGKTLLVMAGGTGGHVFPALAVADCLREQGVDVHWMGTAKGIEARVVPAADIPLHLIDVQGLRGKGKLSLLGAPLRLLKAIWQAVKVVRSVKPDAILGMGGFASGPGAVAARLLGIPLVIHEQNAVAGLTNRLSARMAKRVLEAFGGAFSRMNIHTESVGNPVRGPILALPAPAERFAKRQGPLRVLVVGGSLGAQRINELLPEVLAALPADARPEVWHQTGRNHHDATVARYEALGVTARVVPFIEQMDEAYGWADWVICRAGALTVSELAIAGLPALLVPFPWAVDDHQTGNARFLEQAGAAWLIQQKDLTPDALSALLQQQDRAALLARAEKAKAIARPDASARVAEICLEIMK